MAMKKTPSELTDVIGTVEKSAPRELPRHEREDRAVRKRRLEAMLSEHGGEPFPPLVAEGDTHVHGSQSPRPRKSPSKGE